jgi:hypothetical protein
MPQERARVTLRRDHVAGLAFLIGGALVLAVSADLPFGTLASPGAGMLPTLAIALVMLFGLVLVLRAGESPPFADIAWDDLGHAARVAALAAAAIALYTTLGFLVTISLMMFALTFGVERRPLLTSALFSVGVTGVAYVLFSILLKSPLPRGLLAF